MTKRVLITLLLFYSSFCLADPCKVSVNSPSIKVDPQISTNEEYQEALYHYANKEHEKVYSLIKKIEQPGESILLLGAASALLLKNNADAIDLVSSRKFSNKNRSSIVNISTAAILGCVQNSGIWIDLIAKRAGTQFALDVAINILGYDSDMPLLVKRLPFLIAGAGVPEQGWSRTNWARLLKELSMDESSPASSKAKNLLKYMESPDIDIVQGWGSEEVIELGFSSLSYELSNTSDLQKSTSYLEISEMLRSDEQKVEILAEHYIATGDSVKLVSLLRRSGDSINPVAFGRLINFADENNVKDILVDYEKR